jgi:SPP1 family phage portal protein
MYGRRPILTDVPEITDANVVDVIEKAMGNHEMNRADIQYLWDYYRGKQPILYRTKAVRPEICNKIVENRANEIVSFKVGYLCGEPIQYIGRSGEESVSKGIAQLNEMMFSENKATQDKEVVEWQMIAGTAFRLVLPDDMVDEDDAPFEMFTLDPRDSFVIYSVEVGKKSMLGVKYYTDDQGGKIFSVYSDKKYWKIKDGKIIESKAHALNTIPIFEYPANNARLGAFEIVLHLLDELNNIASNRMDGIEQFVQAFIKFINCDITEEEYKKFLELGAIKVKSHEGMSADVDMVSNELNQGQTQVTKDDVYQAILTICGIPNRNGGSSTSDTGSAVLLRDGWSLAEARAKDSELMFKKSEQNMLKLILKICRDSEGTPTEVSNLRLKDISLKFTRRNYEAIQSKSQVLVSMLQQPKIHPRLAFESSGLFIDPESAYSLSMKYYEEQMEKAVENQLVTEKEEDTEIKQ